MTPNQSLHALSTIYNLMLLKQAGKTAQKAFDDMVTTAHAVGLTALGTELHRLKIAPEIQLTWLEQRIRTLTICENAHALPSAP